MYQLPTEGMKKSAHTPAIWNQEKIMRMGKWLKTAHCHREGDTASEYGQLTEGLQRLILEMVRWVAVPKSVPKIHTPQRIAEPHELKLRA